MKIYVRERQKVGTGVKQPRFRVVAVVTDAGDTKQVKVEGTHFRKTELEQIAADTGAVIIYLEEIPEEKHGRKKEGN
ncbi:hypothetical protein [Methanocalculus sp.]|uniref:hypothetical protein n=1 Tax=Methanocalculus sp. TaxID=2004547 RepID=UPI00272648C3|nr:hypothetical protein [Methanocalculus sp.]MDO8840804.1 hypothetical protein [Methanocalculus sp.]